MAQPSVPAGSLAFDGERELTFTESDRVSVRLVADAFRTIDVPACMAFAAPSRAVHPQPGSNHMREEFMSNPFPLPKEQLLDAYRRMRTIRDFEERLHVDFSRGEIPASSIFTPEATAVGIMAHLHDRDRIASTHRGHGHCIAKGVDVKAMMAEIYGKGHGLLRGQGRLDAYRRPVPWG